MKYLTCKKQDLKDIRLDDTTMSYIDLLLPQEKISLYKYNDVPGAIIIYDINEDYSINIISEQEFEKIYEYLVKNNTGHTSMSLESLIQNMNANISDFWLSMDDKTRKEIYSILTTYKVVWMKRIKDHLDSKYITISKRNLTNIISWLFKHEMAKENGGRIYISAIGVQMIKQYFTEKGWN